MDINPPEMSTAPAMGLEPEPLDDVLSWFLLNADMEQASEEMISSLLPPTIDVSGLNNMFDDAPSAKNSKILKKESASDDSDSDASSNDTKSRSEMGSKKRKTTDSSKSRESAKENRKRQRLRLEALGSRVKALQEENDGLKAHILNVTQRKAEVQKHRMDMERMMARKVLEKSYKDEPDNQEELQKLVQNFRDLYADYGAYRHKEVAYHIQQIEKLLLPSRVTKMAMWTLTQDGDFYNSQKSPFWSLLSKELELTAEQSKQMMQHRPKAKILADQLKESVELVKELRVAIEMKHNCFDFECGKIEAVCNPKQSVMFLMWVTRNVELLSKVIPDFDRTFPHVPVVGEPVASLAQEEELANAAALAIAASSNVAGSNTSSSSSSSISGSGPS